MTKRSRQRCKGPICRIGLSGCSSGKLGGDVIFAKREMSPGARMVKTPQMTVTRTEHCRPVEQRFRLELASVPQQIEALRKVSLRKAWIEFQRQINGCQCFVVLPCQA